MSWKMLERVGIVFAILAGLSTVIALLYEILDINVFSYVLIFMEQRIPVWGIGLMLVICVIAIMLIKKYSGKKRGFCKAAFADYKEDVFEDKLYRWEYINIGDRYVVDKILSLCLKCSCQIVNNECRICGATFVDMMDRRQIEAMIHWSIEKKYGASVVRALENDSNV